MALAGAEIPGAGKPPEEKHGVIATIVGALVGVISSEKVRS